MIVKQDAIVLRCVDYGDSSQILTLFTKDHGKIGSIAKGAKQKKNPSQGILEPLNYLSVIYYQKPLGQLGIVKECELKTHFPGIRACLDRLFTGLYFIEMVTECTAECDPNERLFKLLRYGLHHSENGLCLQNLFLYWQWHALNLLGFSPFLGQCIHCKNRASRSHIFYFSAQEGGGFCSLCKKEARGPLLKLHGSSMEKLDILIRQTGERWKEVPLLPLEYREICGLFRSHLQSVTNKDLRLARYMQHNFR